MKSQFKCIRKFVSEGRIRIYMEIRVSLNLESSLRPFDSCELMPGPLCQGWERDRSWRASPTEAFSRGQIKNSHVKEGKKEKRIHTRVWM